MCDGTEPEHRGTVYLLFFSDLIRIQKSMPIASYIGETFPHTGTQIKYGLKRNPTKPCFVNEILISNLLKCGRVK